MYIIGDVHGCYKTLQALINKLPKNATICFVGDLVDRGPDSKKVINLVKTTPNYYCVKGNHEDMFANHNISDQDYLQFVGNGGNTTLDSYDGLDKSLLEHTVWADSLPLYLEFPDLVLNGRHLVVSHSSIARVWKERTTACDFEAHVLWNRDISCGTLPSANNIYNVFGHTVQKEPTISDFFACIDTGCVYKEHKGYGKLTALHFPSLTITQQDNID